ncbi:MAG: hypothetical protein PVI90_18460 [Desulfobacteraceae bacterium]|jgi:hypothetical protein
MVQNNSSSRLKNIVQMAMNHGWCILTSLTLAIIAGMLFAVTFPKFYQALTMIILQPQQVTDISVPPKAPFDVDDKLKTRPPKILGDTNRQWGMNTHKLFGDDNYGNVYWPDKMKFLKSESVLKS